MTDQAAWFARAAALVVALVAGVTLFAGMPGTEPPEAQRARIACEGEWLGRFSEAMRINPDAAMRREAEFRNRCGAAPRATWDPPALQRGLILAGVAVVLLLTSIALGSMAKREALAAESLREMKRRRHD
jgi:uncharacterized membrane protein YtjA (UPF0391 family)